MSPAQKAGAAARRRHFRARGRRNLRLATRSAELLTSAQIVGDATRRDGRPRVARTAGTPRENTDAIGDAPGRRKHVRAPVVNAFKYPTRASRCHLRSSPGAREVSFPSPPSPPHPPLPPSPLHFIRLGVVGTKRGSEYPKSAESGSNARRDYRSCVLLGLFVIRFLAPPRYERGTVSVIYREVSSRNGRARARAYTHTSLSSSLASKIKSNFRHE